MGEQRNLTEENVEELKTKLEKMSLDNPKLEYRFFAQDETPEPDAEDTMSVVKEIRRKIDSLERKIDLIFDNHVLMNGKFKRFPNLDKT